MRPAKRSGVVTRTLKDLHGETPGRITESEPSVGHYKPICVPARKHVQDTLVALLERVSDAQAWPILQAMAAEIQSTSMGPSTPTDLANLIEETMPALYDHFPEPPAPKRSSRAHRWQEAVDTLRTLKDEYEQWLENMPENLQDSTTADMLREICELPLDELEAVEHPQGFGRD